MRRHDIKQLIQTVRPHTMVHDAGLHFTIHRTIETIERDVPGIVVECGAWRGGCVLAMLLAQRHAFGSVVRTVHALDTFSGLPPATHRDGPGALMWQASTVDNCVASRADFDALMQSYEFAPGVDYVVHEGLFENTLLGLADTVALLRLDGDWYDSTAQCLRALEPLVASCGTVIIDDYYAWDGCARAVHDYLSRTDKPYRICSLPNLSSAYFVKG